VKFNIPKVELSLFNKKTQDEIKALPETVEVPDIDDLPEEFSKKFTVDGLWETLKKSSRTLGEEGLFNVLVLYYSLESEKMTLAHRATIYGSLGYLISLIDAIPDFTPVFGYSDDFALIAAAVASLASVIDDKSKITARSKVNEIFNNSDSK
jgi:uncharacterized membrane protein YkvA (DUF1232 family)